MGGRPSKIFDSPAVWLGSANILEEKDFFNENDIFAVVSICEQTVPPDVERECGLKVLFISAKDSPDQDLSQYFETCIRFIAETRRLNLGTYIHCAQGMSRSTTILTAYMMVALQMSFRDCIGHIHRCRYIVCPNDGFRRQLVDFGSPPTKGGGGKGTDKTKPTPAKEMHDRILAAYTEATENCELAPGGKPVPAGGAGEADAKPVNFGVGGGDFGDKYFSLTLEDEGSAGMGLLGGEITTLVPGGWAERNGVELDDEVFKVDGIPVAGMLRSERNKLLQRKRPLKIEFLRPEIKDSYFTAICNDPGIGVTLVAGGTHVQTIEKLGWAHRNGIQWADQFVFINGKSMAGMSAKKQDILLTGRRPLMIRVKRYHSKHLEEYIKETGRRPDDCPQPMGGVERAGDKQFKSIGSGAKGGKRWTLELDVDEIGIGTYGSEITTVHPGKWADLNGILEDDEVLMVDDVPWAGKRKEERKELLKRPKPLKIQFMRPLIADTYFTKVCEEADFGWELFGAHVDTVEPGGWAEKNGLEFGDQVLFVDDRALENANPEKRQQLFNRPRPLRMRFKRYHPEHLEEYKIMTGRGNVVDGDTKSGIEKQEAGGAELLLLSSSSADEGSSSDREIQGTLTNARLREDGFFHPFPKWVRERDLTFIAETMLSSKRDAADFAQAEYVYTGSGAPVRPKDAGKIETNEYGMFVEDEDGHNRWLTRKDEIDRLLDLSPAGIAEEVGKADSSSLNVVSEDAGLDDNSKMAGGGNAEDKTTAEGGAAGDGLDSKGEEITGEKQQKTYSRTGVEIVEDKNARVVGGDDPNDFGIADLSSAINWGLQGFQGQKDRAHILTGQIIHNSYGAVMFRSGLV